MVKVLERELAWLARDTPGFDLFRAQEDNKTRSAPQTTSGGQPSRRIAHRGSEIFVAVGNELRWSEISLLKDNADEHERNRGRLAGERTNGEQVSYRVLLTPVSRPIQQLSISPSGEYLAILTTHTCHVVVLPASSHLHSRDGSNLRLKAFQVGPTVHVLEKSPLASAIWHPLSPHGDSLVTVTQDACVRLWELDRNNRDSFGTASLAVDLRKLSNAASTQDNFSTSGWGINAGFSPDAEEMHVASACFGGQGWDDEHGWASMTLWIAMTAGGLYALCPFLPSRWRAPSTMLPSLSTSVVAKTRAISRAAGVSERERRMVEQQSRWLADVDGQEALMVTVQTAGFEQVFETFSRPEKPGAIPKLQGPFEVCPDTDVGDVTDIHVIGPRIGDEALYDEYDHSIDGDVDEGLSVSIICLATTAGKVHVCLDMNGVQAEWLPTRKTRSYGLDESDDDDEVLLFETIDLAANDDATTSGWSMFTASPVDRYTLFATLETGVYSLSFRPWISRLESELSAPADTGADFRLDILLNSGLSQVDRPIAHVDTRQGRVESAVAIADDVLGYILLSTSGDRPYSALLELPFLEEPYAPDDGAVVAALPSSEPRAPYQPDARFFAPSQLSQFAKEANDKRVLGTDLKSSVRFSNATLQLMTDAHRVLGQETSELGDAAAGLFRRVERLRSELQEQVRNVRDLAQRVDAVLGVDGQYAQSDEPVGREKIDLRIQETSAKTTALNERVESLQKRIRQLGGRELSGQEQAFASEVKAMAASIDVSSQPAPTEPGALLSLENSSNESAVASVASAKEAGLLAKRLSAATQLQKQLMQQALEVAERVAREEEGAEFRRPAGGGNGQYRKKKMDEVWQLMERESAMVEAVRERLDRISRGTS